MNNELADKIDGDFVVGNKERTDEDNEYFNASESKLSNDEDNMSDDN